MIGRQRARTIETLARIKLGRVYFVLHTPAKLTPQRHQFPKISIVMLKKIQPHTPTDIPPPKGKGENVNSNWSKQNPRESNKY